MIIKDKKKPALYYADRAVSYSEVINNSYYFSSLLKINQSDRVVICFENRPEWYFSLFGIWLSQGTAVAVDYLSSAEEISYILEDCVPTVIFTSTICQEKMKEACGLAKINPQIINIETLSQQPSNDMKKDALEFPDDDETAVMIYTSGTTGKPKGVMLTRKNLSANIYGISKFGMFNEHDVYGAILPFHHIYPLTGTVLMPLVFGCSIVIIEKLSSDVIIGAFQKYGVTILFGIPRLYSMFHKGIMDKINASPATRIIFGLAKLIPSMGFRKIVFGAVHRRFGGKVRYFLSGGSKLDDTIMDDFAVLGIRMTEGYGLSETSPLNSANKRPGVYKRGTIGKTLCNVEAKIVDGEICVKGDNVMKGYYNKPAETAEVIKDGWFYTGDAGSIDKKGYITITGRKRELIVLPNGKKVNPEEIETKIKALHPDMIKEIGVFSKDNGLFAIVLPDFDFLKSNNLVNIFETVRWQVIDKYNRASRDFKKVLNFRIVTDELPRTRIGKLKRFMFPLLAETEVKEVTHEEDPAEEQYSVFKKKLEQLTGAKVYPDSHLELDLGIDSLAKIEMESFIESTYGVSITGQDLSGHSRVKELYELVKNKMVKMTDQVDEGWAKILSTESSQKLKGNGIMVGLFHFFTFVYFRVYLNLKVKGRKNIPKGPVIYAPNHQSFLDGLLMVSSLPGFARRNTYFIANQKHFKKWWRKIIAGSSHILTVNINYNLKESLQKIAFILKKGKSVVIFPEGARTRDGQLMSFKKFFAILSSELGVPVVPVAIDGALQSLPVDTIIPKPGKITVEFLEPVKPDQLSYDEITSKVREDIKQKIQVNISSK
ncbi:MAG TPA: long-chain fatty acid--CoA ligase [Spirochaetia bacterium]|nr:MAG: hypothetical protein A2Y30_00050 [Spirochaetes bacterium GWE1_32_154]OHD44719.1 MAG: hypothetical protein A2Y29_05740 [Spirochaetes bacterium GWE2_31_10]HBI39134.1 long-chain fatty acid--CoA ligase [Spirochaetia bacterium]